MKQLFTLISLLFLVTVPFIRSFSTGIDKPGFYAAMKSNDLAVVDAQLERLEKDTSQDGRAFEGTLLMKKAGLVKGPFNKLKIFKRGHNLLEDALKNNDRNAEYRFLRLMIQENAPGIVNYKDDLQADIALIKSEFKAMPKELQSYILDYSKSSKVLAETSLKADAGSSK